MIKVQVLDAVFTLDPTPEGLRVSTENSPRPLVLPWAVLYYCLLDGVLSGMAAFELESKV